jgi:N6-adenosine-specific RNA methylase IME4
MKTEAFDKALGKALTALRRPDARLVRQHGGATPGFYVCLPHDSFRVPDGVAAKLLERGDVQPLDSGLPGFGGPQSWKLGGNWREWPQSRGNPITHGTPAVASERTVSHVTTAVTAVVSDITQDLLGLKASQFHTALVDPPWQFTNKTGKVAPEHQRLRRYRTMTLDEIRALDVARVMAAPAHLYLWCPNALLPDGLRVMEAWGFTYKANIVWHKVRKDGGSDGRGVGFYFRNVTELLLFGVKGSNARTLEPGRTQVNLLETRKREHSRKPDEIYPIIEACSPGPFLELFARADMQAGLFSCRQQQWVRLGDEAENAEASYDGIDDFAKSLDDGYRAIRARAAAGGEGWTPK